MLTVAQKRYFDICCEKIATQKTVTELAAQFAVSDFVIDSAFRWGKRNDVFVWDSQDKLNFHRIEIRDTLRQLEQAFKRCMRKPRKADPAWRPPASSLAALARQILDYRTRLLELDGLYKQTLAIQHSGNLRVTTEPDLSRLTDDELNQLETISTRAFGQN